MDTAQKIAALKKQITLRQISNDSYFLSPQYKEDYRLLSELNRQLRESTRK